MPSCFQLFRKTAPERGAVVLQQVDKEMCEHFGEPVHDLYWYNGWYNYICFNLACGQTFEQIRADIREWKIDPNDTLNVQYQERMIECCWWLEENFTTGSDGIQQHQMKQTCETVSVDNKSRFRIVHIQINEDGEGVKVKLKTDHEHRLIAGWQGRHYIQTLWMSAEKCKELGVEKAWYKR